MVPPKITPFTKDAAWRATEPDTTQKTLLADAPARIVCAPGAKTRLPAIWNIHTAHRKIFHDVPLSHFEMDVPSVERPASVRLVVTVTPLVHL